MTEPAAPRALITASEMYPELERLALGAERELLFSFRIFDAATRLRSDEARAEGLETWADLLAHRAEAGVKVHMLMADFDPIYATKLHCEAWESARAFHAAHPDIAILCALHGMRLGLFWRLVFAAKTKARMAVLGKEATQDTEPLRQVQTGKMGLRPVTLHQKIAVADGEHAIIGGLDVDERRFDTPDHNRPADETWHDISLKLSGAAVPAIRHHVAETWATALEDRAERFGPDRDIDPGPKPTQDEQTPRLLRTISRPRDGFFAFGPRTTHAEHETVLTEHFRAAKSHVYLETQFFRHMPLARALADAAGENADLHCVLVLPPAPERILFEGDDGIDARHAQALQMRCIDRLRSAFGDRLAIVSPAKPEPAGPDEDPPLEGAGIVYVHAKVALIDDKVAVIGSANLNGRSMRWDTEASLRIGDGTFTRDLRLRLARQWLGDDIDPDAAHRAGLWNRIAGENARRDPADRKGFALPYPSGSVRRFSVFAPFLPSEMF